MYTSPHARTPLRSPRCLEGNLCSAESVGRGDGFDVNYLVQKLDGDRQSDAVEGGYSAGSC